MIEKVHALIQEFEDQQTTGKLEFFEVKVVPDGLVIQPQPAEAGETKEVELTTELYHTLQIFFSDIDGITSNSPDYKMLKSLLNAHATLERMAHKTDHSKNK